ncbi:MAG: hypothetical protein Q9227_000581 [Pyrenula ochraceoflavens]
MLELLNNLQETIMKSIEITTGARLPLDKAPRPENSEYWDGESEADDQGSLTELGLHLRSMTETITELYKLSFRIRDSTTTPTESQRILHPEEQTTNFGDSRTRNENDRTCVEEIFIEARKEAAEIMQIDASTAARLTEDDSLFIDRIAATIAVRRSNMQHNREHAMQLLANPPENAALSPVAGSANILARITENRSVSVSDVNDMVEQFRITGAQQDTMPASTSDAVPIDTTKGTGDLTAEGLVAPYHRVSINANGRFMDIPGPPANALSQEPFICPYCGLVCPSHYSSPQNWRIHILEDLEPYICTYLGCLDGLQLYGSQNAWLDHERLAHCQKWRCFKHKEATFSSQSDLLEHLEGQHSDLTEAQIRYILELSPSVHPDNRDTCPICGIREQFVYDRTNHLSSHLEKIAILSLVYDREDMANDKSDTLQGPSDINANWSLSRVHESDTASSGTSHVTSEERSLEDSMTSFSGGKDSLVHKLGDSYVRFQPPKPSKPIFSSLKPSSPSLDFCFRIRTIVPNYERQHPLAYFNGYWKPPTIRVAYSVLGDTGWRIWRPSACDRIPSGHIIRMYDETSMFWASDRQAFVQVPYDCTREHVEGLVKDKGVEMDWRRLRFSYFKFPENICISLVGESSGRQVLAAQNTSGWIPELVPFVYQPESDLEVESEYTSLGGKLSILLGLAAFSRDPSTTGIVDTIRNHFRPKEHGGWKPHHTEEENNASMFLELGRKNGANNDTRDT